MRKTLMAGAAALAVIAHSSGAQAVQAGRFSPERGGEFTDVDLAVDKLCRLIFDTDGRRPKHPCRGVPTVHDHAKDADDFATWQTRDGKLFVAISDAWWQAYKDGRVPLNDMQMAVLHELGHVVCDGGVPAETLAGQKVNELRADAFAGAAVWALNRTGEDGAMKAFNAIAQAGYDFVVFGTDEADHPSAALRILAMNYGASRPQSALACRGEEAFLLQARK